MCNATVYIYKHCECVFATVRKDVTHCGGDCTLTLSNTTVVRYNSVACPTHPVAAAATTTTQDQDTGDGKGHQGQN